MARKIMIAAGLLGLGAVLALVFVLSRPNPSPTFADQPNAISTGLKYARAHGLVGDSAEITMAKMSYVEFTELIGDEVSPYPPPVGIFRIPKAQKQNHVIVLFHQ